MKKNLCDPYILTHHNYRANAKKSVLSNDIRREETKAVVTVLKALGRRALSDVNCFIKVTSVMALDGATSYLRLKDAIFM